MDRRSFLKNSALGGSAAAAASLAAPAYAQGARALTMVTSWPRGFAGLADDAELLARNIGEMSDGTLSIEVKHAGELVGAFESFDAVSSGQADMYHAADYYFVNQHPAFGLFTAVPFGMTTEEMNAWYYSMGGMARHHELGEVFGLRSFLAGNTGAQAGGWFNKEIKTPEDLQGLKFRMPGLGGKALGYLGVSVQNLPGGEIYQALSSGALDAAEWVGPWLDEKIGFQEVAKFYYPASFQEPSAALSLATNLDVFNDLTPAQQRVIEVAAASGNVTNASRFIAENGAALERLASGGVKLMEFPESVWDAFGEASQKLYAEFTGDEMFKTIFDDYMAAMRNATGWISRSSETYRRQRDRVMGL